MLDKLEDDLEKSHLTAVYIRLQEWELSLLSPMILLCSTLLVNITDSRVGKFSGDDGCKFEEFLDDYTKLIDRLRIPVEHTPIYLTGRAKLIYGSLNADEKVD